MTERPYLEKDIDRNVGALAVAEQQLAYWQDRVELLRAQLEAKQELRKQATA